MGCADSFIRPADLTSDSMSRRLVVILHGFGSGSENRASMVRAVGEIFPDATLYAPELPYRHLSCDTPMVEIVAHVVDKISEEFAHGRYDDVVLVGHSTGAMVARKLTLAAWGFAEDVRDGQQRRAWAQCIRRIVFLAAINRGWTVSSAIGFIDSLRWGAGVRLLQLRGWLKGLFGKQCQATILEMRRGSAFLATTRLQWLDLMSDPEINSQGNLLIVQTIGTVDDIVSPEDAVDHVLDSTALVDRTRSDGRVWARFFMLEMLQTGHADASSFYARAGKPDSVVFAERRQVLRNALTLDADQLMGNARFLRRRHMEDDLPPRPDGSVQDVVFVIHGIRDKGFWTKKIARKVKELARGMTAELPLDAKPPPGWAHPWPPLRDRYVRSITASYGYFPMAPFLLRWVRQEKVEWLLDLYVEAKARYPNARLHYVGHSNGTYLLAGAMNCCKRVRFERVVLAGSVVRRDFSWSALLGNADDPQSAGRVASIMNYVATGDWVVAIFPNALQPFRTVDLGSGGHSGFDDGVYHPRLLDVRYIKGSHSAGIRENQWDEIATFILNGDWPLPKPYTAADLAKHDDLSSAQAWWVVALGRAPWVPIVIILAVFLVLIPGGLIGSGVLGPVNSMLAGAVLVLYILLLRSILTRV